MLQINQNYIAVLIHILCLRVVSLHLSYCSFIDAIYNVFARSFFSINWKQGGF